MCASLIPHLASAFHRTSQVSQLHLPSMPMRQSIENALQTGELDSSLVIPCACSGACRGTGGWSRERALAWSARTHATAAACPPSKPCQSPTEVQRANSSLGHTAAGYGLVSTIARGVDRAFLSPHCRSADPSTPAGRLAVSPRLEDLPDRPQGRTVTEGAQAEALGTRRRKSWNWTFSRHRKQCLTRFLVQER